MRMRFCTSGKFESTCYIYTTCMSAEPAQKKAYSVDLSRRVVYQRIGMAIPFNNILNINCHQYCSYLQ